MESQLIIIIRNLLNAFSVGIFRLLTDSCHSVYDVYLPMKSLGVVTRLNALVQP